MKRPAEVRLEKTANAARRSPRLLRAAFRRHPHFELVESDLPVVLLPRRADHHNLARRPDNDKEDDPRHQLTTTTTMMPMTTTTTTTTTTKTRTTNPTSTTRAAVTATTAFATSDASAISDQTALGDADTRQGLLPLPMSGRCDGRAAKSANVVRRCRRRDRREKRRQKPHRTSPRLTALRRSRELVLRLRPAMKAGGDWWLRSVNSTSSISSAANPAPAAAAATTVISCRLRSGKLLQSVRLSANKLTAKDRRRKERCGAATRTATTTSAAITTTTSAITTTTSAITTTAITATTTTSATTSATTRTATIANKSCKRTRKSIKPPPRVRRLGVRRLRRVTNAEQNNSQRASPAQNRTEKKKEKKTMMTTLSKQRQSVFTCDAVNDKCTTVVNGRWTCGPPLSRSPRPGPGTTRKSPRLIVGQLRVSAALGGVERDNSDNADSNDLDVDDVIRRRRRASCRTPAPDEEREQRVAEQQFTLDDLLTDQMGSPPPEVADETAGNVSAENLSSESSVDLGEDATAAAAFEQAHSGYPTYLICPRVQQSLFPAKVANRLPFRKSYPGISPLAVEGQRHALCQRSEPQATASPVGPMNADDGRPDQRLFAAFRNEPSPMMRPRSAHEHAAATLALTPRQRYNPSLFAGPGYSSGNFFLPSAVRANIRWGSLVNGQAAALPSDAQVAAITAQLPFMTARECHEVKEDQFRAKVVKAIDEMRRLRPQVHNHQDQPDAEARGERRLDLVPSVRLVRAPESRALGIVRRALLQTDLGGQASQAPLRAADYSDSEYSSPAVGRAATAGRTEDRNMIDL